MWCNFQIFLIKMSTTHLKYLNLHSEGTISDDEKPKINKGKEISCMYFCTDYETNLFIINVMNI